MMAVHKGVGHYGAPITLDQAKKVMVAAEAKARQNDWNVVIWIVDSGGHAVSCSASTVHLLPRSGLPKARLAPRSSFAGRPRRSKTRWRAAV
jgi:Haem-degrading